MTLSMFHNTVIIIELSGTGESDLSPNTFMLRLHRSKPRYYFSIVKSHSNAAIPTNVKKCHLAEIEMMEKNWHSCFFPSNVLDRFFCRNILLFKRAFLSMYIATSTLNDSRRPSILIKMQNCTFFHYICIKVG